MKKTLTLIIFLFLFKLASAQNSWSPAGATWYYTSFCGPPLTDSKVKVTYIKDTLFNAINCKYLKKERVCGPPMGSFGGTQHFFSYENNQIVYLYNANSSFDTLFNFNAAIGDKWLRYIALQGAQGDTNSCNFTRSYVTVLDTGHTLINGYSLKKLVLNYDIIFSQGGGGTIVDTVYEKLGSVLHGWNPIICESYYGTTDIGDFDTFICYEDSTFSLYHKPGTPHCDSIFGTGIKEQAVNYAIHVFPNPSSGEITIRTEGGNASAIEIYNASGMLVKQISARKDQEIKLNLEGSAPGVYLLLMHTETGPVFRKVVIE